VDLVGANLTAVFKDGVHQGKIGMEDLIASYIASKHGVVGLTRTAALEYVKRGIRVNAVNPDLIDTQVARDVVNGDEQAYAEIAKHVSIGRAGRPEEIAWVVLWLCSLERAMWLATPSPSMEGYCALLKRKLLSALMLTAAMAGAIALGCVAARGADEAASAAGTPSEKTNRVKIRIIVENKTLTAALADNATSKDIVSLLPLTLTLKKLRLDRKD
jgi:Enoyl-(Acyl carrier protein) reductase/Cyclophilin-like family